MCYTYLGRYEIDDLKPSKPINVHCEQGVDCVVCGQVTIYRKPKKRYFYPKPLPKEEYGFRVVSSQRLRAAQKKNLTA